MAGASRPRHRRLLSAPATTWRPSVSSPLASTVVAFSTEPECYDSEPAPEYSSSSSTTPNDSDDETNKDVLRKRAKSQVHQRSRSYGDVAMGAVASAMARVDEEILGESHGDGDSKAPIIPQPPPYSSLRATPAFEFDLSSSPPRKERPLRVRPSLPRGTILSLVVDAMLSISLYVIFAFIISRTAVATHMVGKTRTELEPLCKLAKKVVARTLAEGDAIALVRRSGVDFSMSATPDDAAKWQSLVDACQAIDANSGLRVFLSHSTVWFAFVAIKAVLGWMVLRTCPSATDSTRRSKPELNPALAYFYMSLVAHFIVAFLGVWLLQPSLSVEERFAFPLAFSAPGPAGSFTLSIFRDGVADKLSAATASARSIAAQALDVASSSATFLLAAGVGLAVISVGAVPFLCCLGREENPVVISEKAAHSAVLERQSGRKVWFESLLKGKNRGHWEEGVVLVESYKGIKWEKRRWWVDSKRQDAASA